MNAYTSKLNRHLLSINTVVSTRKKSYTLLALNEMLHTIRANKLTLLFCW